MRYHDRDEQLAGSAHYEGDYDCDPQCLRQVNTKTCSRPVLKDDTSFTKPPPSRLKRKQHHTKSRSEPLKVSLFSLFISGIHLTCIPSLHT